MEANAFLPDLPYFTLHYYHLYALWIDKPPELSRAKSTEECK
jgi:hypothetical protein